MKKKVTRENKKPIKKSFLDLPYHRDKWNLIKPENLKQLLVELQLLLDKIMESKKIVILSEDSRNDKKLMKMNRIKDLNQCFVFGFRDVVKKLQTDSSELDLILCDDIKLPVLMNDLMKMSRQHRVTCVCFPGLTETMWKSTQVIRSTICLGIKKNKEESKDFVRFCKLVYGATLRENKVVLPSYSTYMPVSKRTILKKK